MLGVHLGGYLNVLDAALPLMAAAGHGRVLGVTSGSGWRAADAGAYSCAKRAVAALTWQLGRQAPPGVTVNAMSPIAATRMVAAALERARRSAGRQAAGGSRSSRCRAPRTSGRSAPTSSVTDSDGAAAGCSSPAARRWRWSTSPAFSRWCAATTWSPFARVLEAVIPRAFAKAEASQASDGGGNPRFGPIFDEPGPAEAASAPRAILCRRHRPPTTWRRRSPPRSRPGPSPATASSVAHGFGDAAEALSAVVDAAGPIDAIVVAPAGRQPTASSGGWLGAGARRARRDRRGTSIPTPDGPGRPPTTLAAPPARSSW